MKLNIYKVNFKPKYPVPCGLIIRAHDKQTALEIAQCKIHHTEVNINDVEEIDLKKHGQILFYEPGDY